MTETMASLPCKSPAGTLTLVGDGERLTQNLFPDQSPPHEKGDPSHLDAAAIQLDEYFAGGRTLFDLPLELRGTAFQRRVWASGSLTGYRGGLGLKRKLLDFESSGGDPAAFELGWQSGQLSLA